MRDLDHDGLDGALEASTTTLTGAMLLPPPALVRRPAVSARTGPSLRRSSWLLPLVAGMGFFVGFWGFERIGESAARTEAPVSAAPAGGSAPVVAAAPAVASVSPAAAAAVAAAVPSAASAAAVDGPAGGVAGEGRVGFAGVAAAPASAAVPSDAARAVGGATSWTVTFGWDSAALSADANRALAAGAAACAGRVEVVGHTCDVGDAKYNQDLSERRARAVAAALAERGVRPERLSVRGVGEAAVIRHGAKAARRESRRVEVHCVP
jgi:outer membrane protein OmpA-like peptidoglycan-associated protein